MRNLGGDEQHCGSIFAGGHASTATNTRRRVHGTFRIQLWHRYGIAVGSAARVDRDKATGFNNSIEGTPVGNEIFNYRKSPGPPWLDCNRFAVPKMAHMKLAGRRAAATAMRNTVDHQRAHAANP